MWRLPTAGLLCERAKAKSRLSKTETLTQPLTTSNLANSSHGTHRGNARSLGARHVQTMQGPLAAEDTYGPRNSVHKSDDDEKVKRRYIKIPDPTH
jgi:hypothetical protein